MLKSARYLTALLVLTAIVLYRPAHTAEPGANPLDPAKEDLTRVEYPSQQNIRWHGQFIKPHETLETLFGADWPLVARFNRIDRRHVYPGMTIKVPDLMDDIRDYSPLPQFYEPAKRHDKYILVSMTEQWLGAYEYGRLKFSMPAATGRPGFETPVGIFRITARDKNHTSSLYKTDDDEEQYPMDNAMRFHVAEDGVGYWMHARDLPGRPASHGCIGLFDEAMQNRMFDTPEKPVLLDSQKVYAWAVGEAEYEDDSGTQEELEDGPIVEVIGQNPLYRNK
ncbi:MAG: ErfK/YbiS/YcfS/YnhG family protein [Deltaproteobacteria bacterium]|nr:ErfK/YbiS/YcfS/YnhG family protein [Deltaproteobacteria bacterium]